jgi:hypothetical protein
MPSLYRMDEYDRKFTPLLRLLGFSDNRLEII